MNQKKQCIIEWAREERLKALFNVTPEPVIPMTAKQRAEVMAQMPSVLDGLTQKEPSHDAPAIRFECH